MSLLKIPSDNLNAITISHTFINHSLTDGTFADLHNLAHTHLAARNSNGISSLLEAGIDHLCQ